MTRWLLVLLLLYASTAQQAPLAVAAISPGERLSLRDTLEKGLRVHTDRERQYIARVIDLIDSEALSKGLVLTVFQKARQRNPRVPFVYFRPMLDILAAKQGVEIPF
jgi:hypothetical protein